MFTHTLGRYLVTLLCCVALLFSCGNKETAPQEEVLLETTPDATTISISFSAQVPQDLSANATPQELVQFAWEEFIALTWQSSYEEDGKRDNPDTSWNWNKYTDAYPDLVVWETYAHRTELRPADDQMQAFDMAPRYSFIKPPQPANASASFTLFNNLDENNEIGSCNLYAHYKAEGKTNTVVYQAKVNRDEYDYIKEKYPTKARLLAATSKTQRSIKKDSLYYPGATSTCNCPDSEGVICLPCGGAPKPGQAGATYDGAMEIKTAWRKLTAADNPAEFFVRKAIYYEKDPNGTITYNNGDFALVGIHIIHKTQNYPGFVFATWEHVGVEGDDMAYELLDGSGTIVDNYPRFHEIPPVVQQANASVHAQMKALNPNTIWQNYQLVGVQGAPSDDSTSFSYFLANYVIESDPTLADFHGSSIGDPFNGKPNLLASGKRLFNMGGCKGCHGVAQITLGTDFSFLLDTIGKPVPSPDILGPLPATTVPSAKLRSLIAATKK